MPLARYSLGAAPSPRARTARAGARRPRAPRPRPGFHSTRAATRWPATPLFSRTQCKHHQQNCAGEVPPPAPRARGLLSWGPAADPSLLRRSATFPRRTELTAVPPAGDWARPQASRPRRGRAKVLSTWSRQRPHLPCGPGEALRSRAHQVAGRPVAAEPRAVGCWEGALSQVSACLPACVPLGAGSKLDSGSGTGCHPAHVPPVSVPTFNP